MPFRHSPSGSNLTDLLREHKQLIYHLENTPLAVIEYDQDFRIKRWSAQARRLFGWTRSEVMGKHNLDLRLVHPGDRPQVGAAIRRLIDRHESRNVLRNRNYRKDGSILLCEWYNSALLDERGKVFSILSLAQDITHYEQSFMERAIAAVSERERQRIGHELHDTLAQQLAGLAFLGKAFQLKLKKEAKHLSEDAAHFAALASEAALRVRNLSSGLYPAELEQRGLVAALKELALGQTLLYRIPCTLRADPHDPALDSVTALNLYRIAQEAVTNALKHAKPVKVQIRFRSTPTRVSIKVDDDGVGMKHRRHETKGMGVRIMHYRAESMGATLKVESKKGRGTSVSCTLPLRSKVLR